MTPLWFPSFFPSEILFLFTFSELHTTKQSVLLHLPYWK
jgi:hypothetical protein